LFQPATTDGTSSVEKGIAAKTDLGEKETVKRRRALLSYSKEEGLTRKKSGGSSLVLDIASIFKKTKGKLQWSIEDQDESVDGESCVVVVGMFEDNVLIRFYLRRGDSAILRYDPYLGGEHIASSTLKYSRNTSGDLIPTNISTEFFLTNQTIIQEYGKIPGKCIRVRK